jgi:GNAT superfamily N-acetyltransferase
LDLFRNLVKKQIADSDKTILIAEKNDVNVVGLVSIVFLPRLNQIGQELYIPELIVTEKYRNQGIGTMLIEACVYLANQKNCKKLRLESGNKRRESHKFYENMGFESNSLSFTKNLVD